jgi:deoxyribonuclease (pyrimidine dimer)
MTRINTAIKPKNLTDQHLIAELRELPRIFTAVANRIRENKEFDDIPTKFTLGTGHMKFFYNKQEYLMDRHYELQNEYTRRYNKIWDFNPNLVNCSPCVYKNYVTTDADKKLLIERITIRITESKQTPYYYGKKITKEEAINILNQ